MYQHLSDQTFPSAGYAAAFGCVELNVVYSRPNHDFLGDLVPAWVILAVMALLIFGFTPPQKPTSVYNGAPAIESSLTGKGGRQCLINAKASNPSPPSLFSKISIVRSTLQRVMNDKVITNAANKSEDHNAQ